MKPLLIFSLLFSGCIWANEAAERAAIDHVFQALNEPATWQDSKALSGLFVVPDADKTEVDRLSGTHRALIEAAKRPMSEVSLPGFGIRSISFITPDVAFIVGSDVQHGSLMITRIPIVFVMKKLEAGWRIAAIHIDSR